MGVQLTFYQGDASDTVAVAVYQADIQAVGDALDDFSGKFALVYRAGATPLIEKDMVVVDDTFRALITPDESAELDAGNYIGIIEITNVDETYRKETHVNIKVLKQGTVFTP